MLTTAQIKQHTLFFALRGFFSAGVELICRTGEAPFSHHMIISKEQSHEFYSLWLCWNYTMISEEFFSPTAHLALLYYV